MYYSIYNPPLRDTCFKILTLLACAQYFLKSDPLLVPHFVSTLWIDPPIGLVDDNCQLLLWENISVVKYICICVHLHPTSSAMAQWLERVTDDRRSQVRIPLRPLENFGKFVYHHIASVFRGKQ